MITVRLPWPDKRLLPNARVERYTHAEIVKQHRFMAKIETLAQVATNNRLPPDYLSPLAINWTFHPPDKRWRDYDGMISAGKAYQDGIFDALGINDHLVTSGGFQVLEMVKDGLYIVKISPVDDIINITDKELTFIE